MRITNQHLFKMSAIVVALLAMTLFAGKPASTASAAAGPMFVCPDCTTCFPTCDVTDSKLMSLSGPGLESFTGGTLEVGFSTIQPTITIGVFDADSIGPPTPLGLWDTGTVNMKFEVFSDPLGNGVAGALLDTFFSTDVGALNNDWWDHVYDAAALGVPVVGGLRNLVLRISLDGAPGIAAINGFKLRTNRSIALKGQTIQMLAKGGFQQERDVIYEPDVVGVCPPPATTTTYNGTWELSFTVPPNTTRLELWDGEMDFGSGATLDTNDANTPPTGVCVLTGGTAFECDPMNGGNPDIPIWAQGTQAVPEGAKGIGAPPDDIGNVFPGCLFLRAPSVTYRLIPPSGPANAFVNNNPSGTGEWERFLVSSEAADAGIADYAPASIESGVWTLRIDGLDISNQFAMHFTLSVTPPTTGGGQGCSPGYWKQSHHFNSYPAGVLPTDLFTSVGFENAFPGKSLVQVLSTGGGGLTALGRIITGAYLNAATVNNFPFTPAQVVADFNALFPGGTNAQYNALKDKYEDLQDPCPFN